MNSPRVPLLSHAILLALLTAAVSSAGPARRIGLEELDLSRMTAGYGKVQRNLSLDGKPLSIGGRKYTRGVGTHAPSVLKVNLDGGSTRFRADVGVDDEVGRRGSVEFIVSVDGRERWKSGVMQGGQPPKRVNVDLRSAQELELRVTDGGDGSSYDHADWADAALTVTGAAPAAIPATRQVRIETVNSALVFLVGDDRRLYQQHYGCAAVQPSSQPDRARDAYPAAGNAWLFEPALQVTHADGNTSTDLRFVGSRTEKIDPNTTETRIELKDPAYPFWVTLVFRAYRAEDVVEQWSEIRHQESGRATLSRFASAAPVLTASDYWLTQFHGDYLREMNPAEEKLGPGIKILDTKLGVRSHYYSNPSFQLSAGGPAQEETGEVIGGTLAWSGNYQFLFEVDPNRHLRAICGMNPYASQYRLKAGEPFTTPPMLWGWSGAGKGPLSRNFHRWGRKYGLRARSGPRAVLLNNWEATFFDFDEPKLLSLFDQARPLGLELFLLDDGWFGNKYPRNDDRAGLGDWEPNRRKLPNGISALAAEAKRRGLRFGIWVEPEMVNPRSELFEAHPDWVIRQPKRELDLFRNQLILDLTRPQVREFVFKTVDDLLTENPGISYIKWDCNRYITQPGSPYLPAGEQSHLWIDYTRALYDVLGRVARRHPDVEIMICSGGAGRVDYGALRYGHEFWPSDNTDPLSRVNIQWGYSHFFPASALGAHVTHMGNRPLKFAFDVAMSGALGMDLDLSKLSPAEKRFTERAIAAYKGIRNVVQQGDLYRLESPHAGDRASQVYVSPDRRRAVLLVYQIKNATGEAARLPLRGLDPNRRYRVREINLPENTPSALALDGQVLDGSALLRDGLTPPTRKQFDSAVIEITAVEPGARPICPS